MQILLVENEKLTLDGIYRTLPWSELGVSQVHRAMNGVQGVQIAKEIMPEIIITDIKMPRLDGIGMARCIREFLPQSTIIFMSAYTEKELFINAIEVLAFGWLEKPLNIADMAEMIRRAVRFQKKRIQQEENLDQLRGDYEDSLSVIKSVCHDNAVFANSIPAKLRRQIEPDSGEQMNPLIQRLCSYVAESYTDPDICLQSMADKLGVSVPHLCAVIKQELGCTFVTLLTSTRIENAKRLIAKSANLRVRDIAEMVGYRDANYFIKVFKKRTGVSPADYREDME